MSRIVSYKRVRISSVFLRAAAIEVHLTPNRSCNSSTLGIDRESTTGTERFSLKCLPELLLRSAGRTHCFLGGAHTAATSPCTSLDESRSLKGLSLVAQ